MKFSNIYLNLPKIIWVTATISIIFNAGCKNAHTISTESQGITKNEELTGNIVFGPLTSLYSDANMPYTMDGSWATLRNPDGTTTFYETAMAKKPYYFRHQGSFDNPLKTQISSFNWNYNGYNNTWPSGNWLQNIYKYTTDTLIGLVHREDLKSSNNNPYGRDCFYIGLARSFDGGNTWKYLGDVLGTKANTSTSAGGANMGGVPTLLVGEYIYLYFNEFSDGGGASQVRIGPSVARAKIMDVIKAIRKDNVCPFVKYNNGNWNENGMTGTASCILPDDKPGYDTHSDATYCKTLGKYLLTIQTHGENRLWLYQSTDGVNWGNRSELDYAQGMMHPYSSIVSFNPDDRGDSFEVGNEFYIYIVRKRITNYDCDEVYYRKVTINP